MSVNASNLSTAAAALLAIVIACGCGGGGARGQDSASQSVAPAPTAGRAALTVTVRAEPKRGWRDTTGQEGAYDVGAVGAGRAFETINYRALDEIVVWVQPSDESRAAQHQRPSQPKPLSLDVGRPSTSLRVAAIDQPWTISNSSPEALAIYARSESGRVIDLGTVASGQGAAYTSVEAGLYEVLSDARADPVARVYVAPVSDASGRRVQVARSGARVVFHDLPPGPARVACWHPRLPGSQNDLTLAPGASARASLLVGVNQLPEVP